MSKFSMNCAKGIEDATVSELQQGKLPVQGWTSVVRVLEVQPLQSALEVQTQSAHPIE